MSEKSKRYRFYAAWIVAGLTGVLYIATLSPGLLWQDSAMFQVRVHQGDLAGQLGLAASHPLYIVLGRAFAAIIPGDYAWRVNLFSAVCSAGAIGFIFAGLRRLTKTVWPAALGAVLLAVSHTFWTHAVMAEVYGLYALLLSVEMYLLVRYQQGDGSGNVWWLVGLFLVNGLNVSNHLLALLHLPVYGVFVLVGTRGKRILVRQLFVMAAAWIVGAGLYEAMIIMQMARGAGVGATLRSAFFGINWQSQVIGQMPELATWGKCLGYFVLNFPTPLLLLSPVGIYLAVRDKQTRGVAGVWLAMCGIAFVFALRYRVVDQYVFFFSCYIFTAVFVSLAADRMFAGRALATLGAKAGMMALAALPALVYEVAPQLIRSSHNLTGIAERILPSEGSLPGRDSYAYFLRPRKNGDTSARDVSMAALRLAEPNGLIVADNTVRNPMIYLQQVEGCCQGVTLSKGSDLQAEREVIGNLATVDEWLDSGRRVFVVSMAREPMLAEQLDRAGRFSVILRGPVYEVVAQRPGR